MSRLLAPVLGFCGLADSGKTTLLTKVIPLLTRQGLRVGAIKHHGHGEALSPDDRGKDTDLLLRAGARAVALIHPGGLWLNQPGAAPQDNPLEVAALLLAGADLILVEGFKRAPWDKLEVLAPGQTPMLPSGGPILALVARGEPCFEADLPVLDGDQPGEVTDFVLDWWQTRQPSPNRVRIRLGGKEQALSAGMAAWLATLLAPWFQEDPSLALDKLEIFFD